LSPLGLKNEHILKDLPSATHGESPEVKRPP